MLRTGGAIVGGGTAAIINPLATPAGIAGGIAAVDLYIAEDEIEEKEEQIKALTMGDVESYMDVAKKGILEQIYDLILLVGGFVLLFFGASWFYTWKRKRAALPFYADMAKIKDKLEL